MKSQNSKTLCLSALAVAAGFLAFAPAGASAHKPPTRPQTAVSVPTGSPAGYAKLRRVVGRPAPSFTWHGTTYPNNTWTKHPIETPTGSSPYPTRSPGVPPNETPTNVTPYPR